MLNLDSLKWFPLVQIFQIIWTTPELIRLVVGQFPSTLSKASKCFHALLLSPASLAVLSLAFL